MRAVILGWRFCVVRDAAVVDVGAARTSFKRWGRARKPVAPLWRMARAQTIQAVVHDLRKKTYVPEVQRTARLPLVINNSD